MIRLDQLGGASNGPTPSPNERPNMLSIGDSLMWGQGLAPQNRFRELVRLRLGREFPSIPIVELSMARSGAVLMTTDTDQKDEDIKDTFLSPPINPTIYPKYSPDNFTREVPDSYLSSLKQLETVYELLQSNSNAGSPEDIKWILLDGGINDVGIFGIVFPIAAYSDGYFLAGWSSWILAKCKEIQVKMEETLSLATEYFPNATIIVNGYFPVFSYHSVANITKLQSVGIMHHGINVLLSFGGYVGLDSLATASSAWQAGSNKHLKKAIESVKKRKKEKVILFARSNIEGSHCLFGPQTWLWGYDTFPDGIPKTPSQWNNLLLGATPEDQVINERLQQCAVFDDGITCNLASIGHPNVNGAIDYASSITDAMEDAGIIPSTLNSCELSQRKRKKTCTDFSDDWSYQCVNGEATIGKGCAEYVKNIGEKALSRFKDAGNNLKQGANHMADALNCLGNAVGAAADSVKNNFSRAVENLQKAGDNLSDAAECWDQTALDMQKCNDESAQKIAVCNANYSARLNGTCNIQCNSFQNCDGRYGRFNPLRYTCRIARATCITAAAIARGACQAGAVVIREACKALAVANRLACQAGVVLGNVVCTVVETAKSVANVFVAGVRIFIGVATAAVTLSNGWWCAMSNSFKAGGKILLAGMNVALGTIIGIGAATVQAGCSIIRWGFNRVCRLSNWLTNKACRLGSRLWQGACYVTYPVVLVLSTTSQVRKKEK